MSHFLFFVQGEEKKKGRKGKTIHKRDDVPDSSDDSDSTVDSQKSNFRDEVNFFSHSIWIKFFSSIKVIFHAGCETIFPNAYRYHVLLVLLQAVRIGI